MLSNREKKFGLIMPINMCNYPENVGNITPVHSEIIGLQGGR